MAKFCVIIPAAGKAERFGGSMNKTFAKLDGRPVFLRSLEHFINRSDVCQTILAIAPEDAANMKTSYGANLGFLGVKLIEGGARRCDTVAAALAEVVDDATHIAVHDAARPCVTEGMIDSVFAEAVKTGAAILAAPIIDTVKRATSANVIEETTSRENLYLAQTPQVFRRDVLIDAHAKLSESQKDNITDDAQVVELFGHPVSIVISDGTNLKITTKADVVLGNAIIKSRPVKRVPKFGAFEEAQW